MADPSPDGYDLEPTSAPTPTPPPPAREGEVPRESVDSPDAEDLTALAPAGRISRRSRDAHRLAGSDYARIASYRTPAIMLALGAGAVCVILLVTVGIGGAGIYLAGSIVGVPIGVAAYLLCCHLWIGFDMPTHLIALTLAGIYAATDLLTTVLGLLPFGGGLWFIPLIVYVMLLSRFFEIEVVEAVIVGLLTFFAKVAAAFSLAAILT